MRASRTRQMDIMKELTASGYLMRILSMPVEEGRPGSRHNNGSGGSRHHSCTRELAKYRARRLEEARLKRRILELTAEIARDGADCRRSRELRESTLRLGKVMLMRRQLEELRDSISDDLTRLVVEQRYFTEPERRLPSWAVTAREIGAAVTGEELRRYVTCHLADVRPGHLQP